MQYLSTRGQSEPVSFSEAVSQGLAPDGGLYLPESLPRIAPWLEAWEQLNYAELCLAFLELFATDVPPAVLEDCVGRAYRCFDHAEVAPLTALRRNLKVLELFHGPTLAFKDFALQLLGNLYEAQIGRTGRPINVLGATSGDTGSAAIHGLLGRQGVNIFILYPRGRTSEPQERQMTCTGAANVYPLAIEGSFDDAQAALKEIFADQSFRERYGVSAVNSINIARVLAQCVYYIHAWLRLAPERREGVEFIVPTGNFGNVLAGWMVRRMGLPVERFRVATNRNDILHRLFSTGLYEVGRVEPSHAPSMDIQVASNFERFLYYALEQDSAQVREVMETFRSSGRYVFNHFDTGSFTASRSTDADIARLIRSVYQRFGYVVDPHTACAFQDVDLERGPIKGTQVVLATAHPAKFPDLIRECIGHEPTHPSLEALKAHEKVFYRIPAERAEIQAFIAAHAHSADETAPL